MWIPSFKRNDMEYDRRWNKIMNNVKNATRRLSWRRWDRGTLSNNSRPCNNNNNYNCNNSSNIISNNSKKFIWQAQILSVSTTSPTLSQSLSVQIAYIYIYNWRARFNSIQNSLRVLSSVYLCPVYKCVQDLKIFFSGSFRPIFEIWIFFCYFLALFVDSFVGYRVPRF